MILLKKHSVEGITNYGQVKRALLVRKGIMVEKWHLRPLSHPLRINSRHMIKTFIRARARGIFMDLVVGAMLRCNTLQVSKKNDFPGTLYACLEFRRNVPTYAMEEIIPILGLRQFD